MTTIEIKPKTIAGRLAMVEDLLAPLCETGEVDEYGEPILERRPDMALIAPEQALKLLEGA
jgi:hypothetical protein